MTQDGEVQHYQVEKLKIEIYPTREAAGAQLRHKLRQMH